MKCPLPSLHEIGLKEESLYYRNTPALKLDLIFIDLTT